LGAPPRAIARISSLMTSRAHLRLKHKVL
jgi:hypothetical protein